MNGAVLLLGAPCTQPERWARCLGTAHARTVPELLRWWQQVQSQPVTHSPSHFSRLAQPRVLLLAPDPGLPLHPADETADNALRAGVQSLGLPLQVLYPSGPQDWALAIRLALNAVPLQPEAHSADAVQAVTPPARAWHPLGCEDCSDPACERRLFQDLLAQRKGR